MNEPTRQPRWIPNEGYGPPPQRPPGPPPGGGWGAASPGGPPLMPPQGPPPKKKRTGLKIFLASAATFALVLIAVSAGLNSHSGTVTAASSAASSPSAAPASQAAAAKPSPTRAATPAGDPQNTPAQAQAPAPTQAPAQAPAPAPSTPAPATTSCHPLSDEETCYRPGEYCRDDDHNTTGVAGDGEAIICEDNDGWRWEPETS